MNNEDGTNIPNLCAFAPLRLCVKTRASNSRLTPRAAPLSTNGQRIRPRMKTRDKRIAPRLVSSPRASVVQATGAAAGCHITGAGSRVPLLRPYRVWWRTACLVASLPRHGPRYPSATAVPLHARADPHASALARTKRAVHWNASTLCAFRFPL